MPSDVETWLVQFAGDPVRRFWEKVSKSHELGCWLWTAGKNHQGYGKFGLWTGTRVTQIQAHRLAWILTSGRFIPEGMQLDHFVCHNKSCVNPSHVRICTAEENIKAIDGAARKQMIKTHCDSGHEFSGHNLRIKDGWRQCRTCNNENQRRRRAADRKIRIGERT